MNYPEMSSRATNPNEQVGYPSASGSSSGSIKLMRTIGYGLLILSILDLVAMVVPFDFKNPVWEFQRFGELVERSAVPLIGIALVFYGEGLFRNLIEKRLLKALSWFTLVVGIGFILLIPIAVSNVNRINVANFEQLSAEYSQQQEQADQIEQQISTLNSNELAEFLASQGQVIEGSNPDEIKENVLAELTKSRAELKLDFEATKAERQGDLLSDAMKWSLGAIVSSALFVYVWILTPWARKPLSNRQSKSKKRFG